MKWWTASPSQLFRRVMQLESELSVAAALLDLREEMAEKDGMPRSGLVTELQAKWKALLDAEPEIEEKAA